MLFNQNSKNRPISNLIRDFPEVQPQLWKQALSVLSRTHVQSRQEYFNTDNTLQRGNPPPLQYETSTAEIVEGQSYKALLYVWKPQTVNLSEFTKGNEGNE